MDTSEFLKHRDFDESTLNELLGLPDDLGLEIV